MLLTILMNIYKSCSNYDLDYNITNQYVSKLTLCIYHKYYSSNNTTTTNNNNNIINECDTS